MSRIEDKTDSLQLRNLLGGPIAHSLRYTTFSSLREKHHDLIVLEKSEFEKAHSGIIDSGWHEFELFSEAVSNFTKGLYIHPQMPVMAVVRHMEFIEESLRRGVCLGLYSSVEKHLYLAAEKLKLPLPKGKSSSTIQLLVRPDATVPINNTSCGKYISTRVS